MSVKMMTTDQIQNDLATIAAMWAGGIPPEQQDRVNALKGELKRRGEQQRPISLQPMNAAEKSIDAMTDDQLQKELSSLSERISKNPGDDMLQEQFANVRFELRKRARNGSAENLTQIKEPHSPKVVDASSGGETFKSQIANGTGNPFQESVKFENLEAMKKEFADRQATAQKMAEELVRKHTVANLAAKVTAGILSKYGDPNGDDIENACTIGVAVAKSIADKVGL